MSKVNQDDNNNPDQPQEENKSTKNRLSKVGTAIKSAAEYGLVNGVGKTIKNFASGVSSGAKQGYGYFTTDRNMNTAIDDSFNQLDNLLKRFNRNPNEVTNEAYYNNLSLTEKFKDLIGDIIAKPHSIDGNHGIKNKKVEKEQLLQELEPIVKNQIKDLSVLALDSKYDQFLTGKEYIDYNIDQKIVRLGQVSLEIFNKMHDKRAKQTDFIATTRKIEQYTKDLDTIELPNLAGAAGISNGKAYQNAQTYDDKISLIEIALKAKQHKSNSQSLNNNVESKIKTLEEDQQLTNTSFEHIKKTVDDLHRARTNSSNTQHPIETHLKRLETAKQTLANLQAAEKQLLNPKQNRAVRTLKTAAGLIAGATLGMLKGSGSAIKTAAKAVTNAPSGIKETYRKNRTIQHHR